MDWEEGSLNWHVWMRRIHRWTSIVFTLVVIGIFTTLGLGHEPAQWVYLSPLPPLAVMTVTGLYMFVLPYLARRVRPAGGPE